jgi:hypothetical protein
VCIEMEKSFIVESKIFVFSVLNGALMLRVGEKRKSFSGEIIISSRCSEWLTSTLEILLALGSSRRSRLHQILQGRVENLDCSER